MLIDTHCHINIMIKERFDIPLNTSDLPKAELILKEAKRADVDQIINVGTSLVESTNCVELARAYDSCFAAIGIHPNDCTQDWLEDLKAMRNRWFKNNDFRSFFKIVAVGEIGLDTHYPEYNLPRQIDAFKAQIELALEFKLPIIVHTREAPDQTLKVLDEYKHNNLRGVIHCFSEGLEFAQAALDLGFVLGIGGPLTYPKNDILRTVFTTIPLDSIILETDSPYLAPQSIRGKKNSPAQIQSVAKYLAELRQTEYEKIAQITTKNAKKLFKL